MVRLMAILKCILDLYNQSCIDFKIDFDQDDISRGQLLFIDVSRYVRINERQCGFVLKFKKYLYGQAKCTQVWD